MHSSKMRTARLLTVSQHALGGGNVYQHALGRGVSAQDGMADTPPPRTKGRHPPLWTDRHLWKHNLRKQASATMKSSWNSEIICVFDWQLNKIMQQGLFHYQNNDVRTSILRPPVTYEQRFVANEVVVMRSPLSHIF